MSFGIFFLREADSIGVVKSGPPTLKRQPVPHEHQRLASSGLQARAV